MHHVCGEHEWDGATCSHGPLTEVEGGKEYLAMNSKAAKELRKIVLDHEWLKSLEHYVLFRYILGEQFFDDTRIRPFRWLNAYPSLNRSEWMYMYLFIRVAYSIPCCMAWSVSTQNKANPAMSLVTCVGNMLGCLLHNSNFLYRSPSPIGGFLQSKPCLK